MAADNEPATEEMRDGARTEEGGYEPPSDEAQRTDWDTKFASFHANNPHVYEAFLLLARQARHVKGYRRIGINMLYEQLRWEGRFRVRPDDSGFFLNQNFTSRYARLIMDSEPDLADLFETRRLRS